MIKIYPDDNHMIELESGGSVVVVRTNEMLTAFFELQRAIHEFAVSLIS